MLGKNTSRHFLEEWVNVHRKIILAAERKSGRNNRIKDILMSHPIEGNFPFYVSYKLSLIFMLIEDNSLLALKLVPHIAGFNTRKKTNCPEQFFFHEIDV